MKTSKIKYNNGGTVKKTTYDGVGSIEAGARGNNNNASANVTGSLQGKGLRGSASLFKNNQGYTATTVKGSYGRGDFSISGQRQRDNYGNRNTSVRVEQGPFSATASKNEGGTTYGLGYKKTTRKGTTIGVNVKSNAQGLLSASTTVSKPL
jgi:hypothetical protein|tara:strand:- start:854 stop:1306 length:453 start_codon:yes stop_codon:yes gene_type:complete